MDLETEIEMSDSQATLMARALITIARADDGVDPRESELIHSFYSGDPSGLADLSAAELTGKVTGSAARLFLKSCLLVALSDTRFTEKERNLVDSYAAALGVPPAEKEGLVESVREFLLAPLTRLANVEAAAEVSKRLTA